MNRSRLLLTLLSLALVLVVAFWDVRRHDSPGPLHPAHNARSELAAADGCPACHGPALGAAGRLHGVDAGACNHCHEAIAAQLASGRGLHGSLAKGRAAACGSCHREHFGANVPLLEDRAFAAVGVPDRRAYDHAHVAGFALDGAHRTLACARCHRHAEAGEPPAGGRYLGLDAACTACHQDVHRGAYGADCAHCHGQEQPFARAPGFHHDILPLALGHANRACKDCHPADGAHSTAALAQTPQPVRACATCHTNPHVAAAGAAAPRGFPIRDSADCAACHDTWTFQGTRVDAAAHARYGFALSSAHAETSCRSCHGDGGHQPVWKGTAPRAGDCARCHADPHPAGFAAAAPAPTDGDHCAACHRVADRRFPTEALAGDAHAAVGFPLAAPHAGLACARCHGNAADARATRFPGRSAAQCSNCHRDPHGGQFPRARHGECTDCHRADTFAPSVFDVRAHAATAFPLTGAHEAAGCRDCHREVHGAVRTFVGTPAACSACHRDVHAGAFDRADLPAVVDGRRDCARCHDDVAFDRAAKQPFDHARWAQFPLAGAHRDLACARCHARATAPAAAQRLFARAPGVACADCHRDEHQGQFAVQGRTDCVRCHGEDRFAPARFDHQLDSRFALDATHQKVACATCHRTAVTPAGPLVRYKPLGIECKDCHRIRPTAVGGGR